MVITVLCSAEDKVVMEVSDRGYVFIMVLTFVIVDGGLRCCLW